MELIVTRYAGLLWQTSVHYADDPKGPLAKMKQTRSVKEGAYE
jgi:hypothetical protein